MFMRVAANVFLFLIRRRFSQSKPVYQIIKSQYGDTTIRRLRKFEKTDYRVWKAELDLKIYLSADIITWYLGF